MLIRTTAAHSLTGGEAGPGTATPAPALVSLCLYFYFIFYLCSYLLGFFYLGLNLCYSVQ